MFTVENLASTRNFMDRGAWQATPPGLQKLYMTEQLNKKNIRKKKQLSHHTQTHTHSHHLEAVSVNISASTLVLKHS